MFKESGEVTAYCEYLKQNGIENCRIAEKQEQKIFYKKFLMH